MTQSGAKADMAISLWTFPQKHEVFVDRRNSSESDQTGQSFLLSRENLQYNVYFVFIGTLAITYIYIYMYMYTCTFSTANKEYELSALCNEFPTRLRALVDNHGSRRKK